MILSRPLLCVLYTHILLLSRITAQSPDNCFLRRLLCLHIRVLYVELVTRLGHKLMIYRVHQMVFEVIPQPRELVFRSRAT